MARPEGSARRTGVRCIKALVCSLALSLLVSAFSRMQDQAWQGPRPTRSLKTSRAATDDGAEAARQRAMARAGASAPVEEEEPPVIDAPPEEPRRRPGKLSSGMRSKLMDEANSMGDVDKPITAGFGNPFLLVIVIVLILGAASYYTLGLDKVGGKSQISDEELMKRFVATQDQMYGNGIK
eukprot:TRINITY_DN74550_c0_g1_i1.p1 TRINITY_DN74550_c0_g1~~TRINITY_DN74550_c0_g1_i1.p1  ORF type:complete len:181 (-),score=39.15 TRINITY_DN74550_c0_g1_i1:57-599(-)